MGEKRTKLDILVEQLKSQRLSYEPQWKDIAENMLPYRARFEMSDNMKGDRRNQKIMDSTPVLAQRTLTSGFLSLAASPARQWFRLTTEDPDLAEFGPVKDWLYYVTQRMQDVFLKSNFYRTLWPFYDDLSTFATSPVFQSEDLREITRFNSIPIGSYWIGADSSGQINTFARRFRLSVWALLEMFGGTDAKNIDWSKFSRCVKEAYDDSRYMEWVDVWHVVRPNPQYSPGMLSSKYKKFESVYYEDVRDERGGDIFLSESGYDLFPVLCGRWKVNGTDVYGTDCPAMIAIGDIKQLYQMHKRGLQALEKMVNPPLVMPLSMKSARTSMLPGDVNYVDLSSQTGGARPLYEIKPEFEKLLMVILEIQIRVKKTFFENLLLMMIEHDVSRGSEPMTAKEVQVREEEKLFVIGPLLQQMDHDVFKPCIDNTFDYMNRRGMIPPPPEEIQGQDLKIDYLSIMQQAQKMVGLSGIERTFGIAMTMASADGPGSPVWDKFDRDQALDVVGDITSLPPGIIVPDEKVAAIREKREQAQQAMAQAEMFKQTAMGAKSLSGARLDEENVLKELVGQATTTR